MTYVRISDDLTTAQEPIAMSLHHLDPEQEERACPDCTSGILCGEQPPRVCKPCHGTGRLGNPDARPDVEVYELPSGRWVARSLTDVSMDLGKLLGSGPTQAAALTAARREAQA